MAAYNAGATTVLIPSDNLRDLEELDPLARENLKLIPCKQIREVLDLALISEESNLEIPKHEGKKRTAAPLSLPASAPANQVQLAKES